MQGSGLVPDSPAHELRELCVPRKVAAMDPSAMMKASHFEFVWLMLLWWSVESDVDLRMRQYVALPLDMMRSADHCSSCGVERGSIAA